MNIKPKKKITSNINHKKDLCHLPKKLQFLHMEKENKLSISRIYWMEMLHILLKDVRWRQVSPTTKPPLPRCSRGVCIQKTNKQTRDKAKFGGKFSGWLLLNNNNNNYALIPDYLW